MNRRLKCLFANKKLLFLSTINIMLVLIVLYFFCPLYEENDDFGISCIASGIYGKEYMQYLIYSNIIYGYFLRVFGLIFSGVNWYVIMQYLLLTVSVIAIFYCFSFRFPFHIVVCANMLFWYMGFLQQIRRIQFTRTASVLCIAGFVLIWHGISLSKRIANILGIVLIVLGSSIRLDCFFSVFPFFIVLFFFLCFSKEGVQRQIFQRYLKVLFILLCVIGLFIAVNHICYYQNEEWADYKRYNAVRSELLDYGLPGWADYGEKYEAIGYTENDIRILGGWILEDNKKFDYEHLSEIASWKQKPKFDTSWIQLYLKDFLTKKHSTVLFDIWMIFLVVCLFKNNICRFFSVSNLILMMGEYFWLYYKGRVLPRAEYGIILSAIFSLLICFANYYVKKDYNKQFCIRFVAGTLIFSLLFLRNDYVIHYRDYYTGTAQKDWEAQGKLLEKLSQNTDCVYVLNTISFI